MTLPISPIVQITPQSSKFSIGVNDYKYIPYEKIKSRLKKELKRHLYNLNIESLFDLISKEYYFFCKDKGTYFFDFYILSKVAIDKILESKGILDKINLNLCIENSSLETYSFFFVEFKMDSILFQEMPMKVSYIGEFKEIEITSDFYFHLDEEKKFHIYKDYYGISARTPKYKRFKADSNKKDFGFYYPIKQVNEFLNTHEIGHLFFQTLFRDNPVLKDLNKEDLKSIKVPLESFKNLTTKQALIEAVLETKIPYNLNRLSFQIGFAFACFLAVGIVSNQDSQKFYEFALKYDKKRVSGIPNLAKKSIFLKIKRKKYEIHNLIESFYQNINKDNNLLKDTINMALEIKEPISLKLKAYKGIQREHDRILNLFLEKSKTSNKATLKIAKQYKELAKKLPKEFELIKTETRLEKEGLIQNHCVYSYKDTINKGQCAIFSLFYENQRYTIEIRNNRKNYIVKQIKGKNNTEPSSEIWLMVNQILKGKSKKR
ncbi:PcfJ domain-containing protein [Campylobacter coli]|nr:PcfJ domain-containing protein [Campylobacter coli]